MLAKEQSLSYYKTGNMLKELIFVLFFTGALVGGQNACPPEFIPIYTESSQTTIPLCMQVQAVIQDFQDHLQDCQSKGLSLAQPETLNAQSELRTYILGSSELVGRGFFLGGSDEAVEGVWRWMSSGNEIIAIWSIDPFIEPDGGREQNCACLWREDYLMHSCECDYKTYAVCQL